MYCKNCGKELSKEDSFCKECGTKVVKKSTKENKTNININTTNVVVESKSKAVASLVIGVISFIFGYFILPLPIVGLVLGLSQKGNYGEKTAGIVLNAISILFSILLWAAIFFLIVAEEPKNYESREDNFGNSDVIINDQYDGKLHQYIDLFN